MITDRYDILYYTEDGMFIEHYYDIELPKVGDMVYANGRVVEVAALADYPSPNNSFRKMVYVKY